MDVDDDGVGRRAQRTGLQRATAKLDGPPPAHAQGAQTLAAETSGTDSDNRPPIRIGAIAEVLARRGAAKGDEAAA